MTSMVAGRGGFQVTFLIHTSIVKPYQLLHKLCKPATGGSSGQGARDTPTEATSPTTQIVLKEYDSQIISSLLSFLYTNEYWPEMPLLLDQHEYTKTILSQQEFSPSMLRKESNPFTAHAITSHHFKLAMLASKFSVEALLLLCRQKIDTTLRCLSSRELLDLVRTLYSKDYSYREQFFELITYIEDGCLRKNLGHRSFSWSGVSFWTKDVLEKLMSQESQNVRPDSPVGSMQDGETGEVHPLGTRDEFLKMVASQGGELASDVVKAFWEAGFGLKLSAKVPPETTQTGSTLTLDKERNAVMDVDGAYGS